MVTLYNWYPEFIDTWDYRGYILHGIVFGHPKLSDGTRIHTSLIQSIEPFDNSGRYCAQTMNTTYMIEMKDCRYSMTGQFLEGLRESTELPGWLRQWKDRFPHYKEKYRIPDWNIPMDGILLRVANYRKYYFDGMAAPGRDEPYILREPRIHLGMCEDSVLCVLCQKGGGASYDLRYFAKMGNYLEFYVWRTNGLPVYLENSGQSRLTVSMTGPFQTYTLKPGQRIKTASAWKTKATC